jgi:hypothetical protein
MYQMILHRESCRAPSQRQIGNDFDHPPTPSPTVLELVVMPFSPRAGGLVLVQQVTQLGGPFSHYLFGELYYDATT